MPTISSAMLPAPKSWDEFEEITRSSFKIKWSSPNLTRIGRQGQPQDGVDIYGENDLGQNTGVQCKLVQDLSLKTILDEVEQAENFTPSLDVYYIATTAPTDSKLQKELRIISKERVSQNKFPIGIFFWNDIIQDLITNEAEFQKHYQQFVLKPQERPAGGRGNRQISLLDIAYFGRHIHDNMNLLFHEFSWEPEGFTRFITDLDACVKVVMEGQERANLVQEIQALSDYTLPVVTGKEARPKGWGPAKEMATSIENKIKALEYRLEGQESIIFKLGQYLGNWNHAEYHFGNGQKLSERHERMICSFIEKISNDGAVPPEVVEKFKEYRETDSIAIVHIPHSVYNRVRSMIYEQMMP
ncbi:hypothetical protein [Tumebacillus algifaecis]|uniref:hypothetical protein n=1 Tax=Tumebacillus algifaecis TaxID=1214604 RepID=UPI00188002D2|nr:hypothetical protein [Tumebacillus algifaecis]